MAAGCRKIGGGVSSPELIFKVDPEFSEEARKAKFMGIVLVNLIVDQKGNPQNVQCCAAWVWAWTRRRSRR